MANRWITIKGSGLDGKTRLYLNSVGESLSCHRPTPFLLWRFIQGRKQAAAAGAYFAASGTRFDVIYTSDLLRANATAQAIHGRQQEPFPSFILTTKLREQHFGEAEGKFTEHSPPKDKTLEELFSEGIYPVLFDRDQRHPGGESLNDLASRADEAIAECVVPHLGKDVHVALVSHSLCIRELVAALSRLGRNSSREVTYKGLPNTGWMRATISTENDVPFVAGVPLDVCVTHENGSEHLKGLLRPEPEP